MVATTPQSRTLPTVRFELPEAFVEEEVTATFGPRVDPSLRDPRALQRQVSSRPSLVTQSRRVERGAALGRLVAEIVKELSETIPAIRPITPKDVTFVDGAPGVLLDVAFSLDGTFEVGQLLAARLDDGVLTTLTYSIERSALTGKVRADAEKTLLSAQLTR